MSGEDLLITDVLKAVLHEFLRRAVNNVPKHLKKCTNNDNGALTIFIRVFCALFVARFQC